MHLFNFIRAMTGCDDNSIRKEWEHLENKIDKAIVTKITIAQKVRFPEIYKAQLTRSDSMTIDIYGAAKVALAIGARANWFNEILTSLGNRSSVGDPELLVDVQYMNIAQQIVSEYEPDNFLRLWGEEFLANTSVSQAQRDASNPENLVGSMAATAANIMGDSNIARDTVRASYPKREINNNNNNNRESTKCSTLSIS